LLSGRDFPRPHFFQARGADARRRERMPPQILESEVAEQWDRNAEVWADQVRKNFDIFRMYWKTPHSSNLSAT
jgi:hypothetical protein